jgi:hypothetical protein
MRHFSRPFHPSDLELNVIRSPARTFFNIFMTFATNKTAADRELITSVRNSHFFLKVPRRCALSHITSSIHDTTPTQLICVEHHHDFVSPQPSHGSGMVQDLPAVGRVHAPSGLFHSSAGQTAAASADRRRPAASTVSPSGAGAVEPRHARVRVYRRLGFSAYTCTTPTTTTTASTACKALNVCLSDYMIITTLSAHLLPSCQRPPHCRRRSWRPRLSETTAQSRQ